MISLAIHIAVLNHSQSAEKQRPKFGMPIVAVAEAEPVPPPPARRTPQPESQELKNTTEVPPERFRPNIEQEELQEDQAQEVADETATPEKKGPDEAELAKAESKDAKLPQDPQGERLGFKEEIAKYRQQLLGEFKDEWQKVPDLNTVIGDLTLLPKIDNHFGIVILAYSFVDHKPGPPFIVFNVDDGSFQQVDSFDFSSFSNRCKDRMIYAQYRALLDKAGQEYKVNSLMKVVGLVPVETDHYFCAKQLRAAQLAALKLEKVSATNGHYEPDGSGGFNLIIDTVVTTDGRSVAIQDEELKYSVVAKK